MTLSRNFTSYDDDGRVLATGIASNPQEQVMDTGGVLEGMILDGNLWWVENGVPTPRPPAPDITLSKTSIIADGEDELEVSGVPVGASVTFGGVNIVAEGGSITLSTDVSGTNAISIDAFPAQLWEGTFNGTAD